MQRRLLLVLTALLLAHTALAAGREIAPRPMITSPSGYRPVVAAAGGRVLTVWLHYRDLAPHSLMGAVTNARGTRIGPAFIIVQGEVYTTSFAVAGSGDSFTLFWNGPGGIARMTRISLTGRVLATRVLDLPLSTRIHAAWNGKRFLVVTRNDKGRQDAALLSPDGDVLHGAIPVDPSMAVQDILAAPKEFLVFATSNVSSGVYAIAMDGGVTTTPLPYPANHLRAAALPNGNVLIVSSAIACGDSRLVARVWSNGTFSAEQLLYDGYSRPLSVQPGAGRHLITVVRRSGSGTTFGTIFTGDDGAPRSELTDSGVAMSDFDLEWEDTAEAYAVERRKEDGSIVFEGFLFEPRLLRGSDFVRIRAFDGGVPSAPTAWIYFDPVRRRSARP